MVDRGAMINAFDPSRLDELEPDLRTLIDRRRAALGPGYRLFYERPLELVRGEGVHLFDPRGVDYLDAYNNVPCVGHANPDVVAAVSRQIGQLCTHTRYAARPIVDYAERLLATHDRALGNVTFTCTGSEAVDLALRIARAHTAATGVIVTANAYHGVTSAVAEISPNLGANVPLGGHVRVVAPPDPKLGDAVAVGRAFAAGVEAAVADLERHGIRLAALIADSLFSTDGILPDPAGFLGAAVDVAHSAGGVYIAVEVQSGFGRTGTAMWGYQRHGVVPDIVCMGKPMGNGLPIAGVAARDEVTVAFGRIRYFNTFGGNSVSIAAANAVLDVIERDDLIEHARTVGRVLVDGITALRAAHHPSLGAVRGAGLYIAADLVDPATGAPDEERALRVVNGMRERRVLISATGAPPTALKIRPPLVFGRQDAERLLTALNETLREVES